ncbi:MAG: glycosyltransferase family 4 protein [Planctomycetaceae bacterium]|nr:glycosyltransferase family 4 protein [Planctomycetaceae bacterium]
MGISHTQRRIAIHAAEIIAVCDQCGIAARDAGLGNKLHVITNGVDLPRLGTPTTREEVRQRWGIGDSRAIGMVARWSDEKNPMATAHAVNALGPEFTAIYCGPQMRNNAAGVPADHKRQAEELTCGRIVWDYTDDPGGVYRALDCLIVSSRHEGAPLVALEAMACGCPVVTTPVGSMPELEREFPGSLIFVPKHPTGEQLAAAVQEALSDRHQSRLPAIRDHILKFHTTQRMVAEWETIFTAALRNTHPTVPASH